jgi:hypothetical protein
MWWLDNKKHPYKRFTLKMIDISIIGIMYLIGGLLIATFVEYIFPVYDDIKYRQIELYKLILEIFGTVSLVMIAAYFLRHTIYIIPSPFDSWYGYNHSKVSEVKGGVIIAFSIFLLANNFKEKIRMMVKRIRN